MTYINKRDFAHCRAPETLADRFARSVARLIGHAAGAFSGRRYGDRVVVQETIAAVPPMVAATLLHLKSLRRMEDDGGWVRAFMDEAETQREHLMTFVAMRRPSRAERLLIVVAQGIFYNAYFVLHLCSPRTAHRLAAYLAEESVAGYGRYLEQLEAGASADAAAPSLAIAYWNLPPEAGMRELVAAIREDEAIHRDLHHAFADALASGRSLPELPREELLL